MRDAAESSPPPGEVLGQPEGPVAADAQGMLSLGRTPPTAPLAFLRSWGSQAPGGGASRAGG